eukprot:CAMPEP_0181352664 /NCGR_PEP_ID=MMETSP1106-20121128/2429_1 /TAXON_ID=81844 /ORGANISM="Mantoniella antarctica, Strain SL-175" /LENGTH=34 /DNA_ID= /DNA_START= /DNA_END= /DNA_ORIENTATION=
MSAVSPSSVPALFTFAPARRSTTTAAAWPLSAAM